MVHPQEEQPAGAPAWMTTFADLMSLLLTFFVLLLSFSNIEIVKFRTLAGSMRNAFGLRSELDISNEPMGSRVLPMPSPTYSKDPVDRPTNLMMVKLREVLEKSEMQHQGNVEVTERGVTLRLAGDAVFDSGRTELKAGALALLGRLAEMAAKAPGAIEVEGHTDDVPIHTARFPSNWELSAARAGAAVRFMTSRGLPSVRMKAIGYADTRPLAANDSAENRARNRRIEFLFVRDDDEPAAASHGPAPTPAAPASPGIRP